MSRRSQTRAVLLAGLLVVSSFSMVGVGAADSSGDSTMFHVKQGGECFEVTPIGSGDQTVEEFYDYRTPNTTPSAFTYSSHGTQDLQENQVSNVFLYHGTEGTSLVMLHDKLGDGPRGSTITFDISGLPSDRTWAVEDDSYGNTTDDNFAHDETSSTIDWVWQSNRTDGAAVRGLAGDDYDEITIDPAFNEEATRWGDWKWSGDDNRTEEWRLLGGDTSEVASLDMNESVTIVKGKCPDTTDPEADLSASPSPAANDEEVTFDASDSTDNEGIEKYVWDFDGDGEVDRTTDVDTTTYAYDAVDTYTASVTVVDGNENTDTATTDVEVTESDGGDDTGLEAAFSAEPNPVANDESVSFDAGDSSGDVASYEWDLGDGTTESGETASHTYSEPGDYEVKLTIDDGAGNTDTATEIVTVEEPTDDEDTTDPTAEFTVSPQPVGNDEEVTLDASGSSDDGTGIESYEWDLGDGTEKDGETITHSYGEYGEKEVTLTVTDGAGNSDTATETVTVEERETIEYVSKDEVRINGDFETVYADWTFFDSSGVATSNDDLGPVDGTKVVEVPDEGQWGPVISTVSVHEGDIDTPAEATKDNPDFDAQVDEVRPDRPSTFVESATKVDEGTYEVTFGYENPNDAEMSPATSQFAAGNVDAGPPTLFESDRNTFTVTWTPESDDSNLVWETDFGNFGLGAATATSPTAEQIEADSEPPSAQIDAPETVTAGEQVTLDGSGSTDDAGVVGYDWSLGDGTTATGETATHSYDESGEYEVTLTVNDAAGNTDTATHLLTVEKDSEPPKEDPPEDDDPKNDDPPEDEGPTAKLSLSTHKADFGDKVRFDASASTGDDDIEEYRWNFDGDDDIDRRTHTKENATVYHEVSQIYDEPGTYTASVTVVDANGDKDIAGAEITIERNDKTQPGATLHVPETAEVGEEIHLKATGLAGVGSGLSHICWVVDDHDKPDGATATHTFDSTGEKTVALHIVDNAGNSNMIERTITVVEADDHGNDEGDDKKGGNDEGDDSSDEKPAEDEPNEDTSGSGIPTASPSGGTNSNDDTNEQNNRVVASLGDDDVSEVVLASGGATLTINESAPADVRAPTAEADGFAALSYVTVTGADGATATFSVSNDRLDAADAAPEHVSLFRFADGAWTAVDVERLNATDDAQRFAANATNGTYAVGVERPATAVAGVSVPEDRVAPGDRLTVTATITNDGLAEGTHDVELTVDGEVVATESVTVPADSTREVEFARSFDDPGVYQVSVGDQRAEVVVEGIETTESTTEAGPATTDPTETTTESSTDGGVPGFGVGAALVALLASALLARRRS